jgi:homoserine dehydrogenase
VTISTQAKKGLLAGAVLLLLGVGTYALIFGTKGTPSSVGVRVEADRGGQKGLEAKPGVSGDAVGDILLYGRGAGMMPTASAVLSDTVDLARNILSGSVGRIPLLSCQMHNIGKIPVMPVDEISTHYYFRFAALDRPGVLSKISGILGSYGISLKSVHQKGRKTNGSVPLVMLTHLCREEDVKKALDEISRLDVVSTKPALIRIEDNDLED